MMLITSTKVQNNQLQKKQSENLISLCFFVKVQGRSRYLPKGGNYIYA